MPSLVTAWIRLGASLLLEWSCFDEASQLSHDFKRRTHEGASLLGVSIHISNLLVRGRNVTVSFDVIPGIDRTQIALDDERPGLAGSACWLCSL